jgi:hypothetical protein
MNTNTNITPVAISANNIPVFLHPESHSHRPDLNVEAIGKITLPEGTFCRTTIDMGRVIGVDHLVETNDNDKIVYLRRGNRPGETRMVLRDRADDTQFVTAILCVARKDKDTPDELVGKWILVTLYEGRQGEREPFDNAFIDADIDESVEAAKQRAEAFWSTHALVPTDEEMEIILNSYTAIETNMAHHELVRRRLWKLNCNSMMRLHCDMCPNWQRCPMQ